MKSIRSWRVPLVALCAAATALTATSADARVLGSGIAAKSDPIVKVEGSRARGKAVPGGFAFLGIPYAAPPVGVLRWKPPQRAAGWHGVRDATQYAASCPQQPSGFAPPGPESENCLYLNVSTNTLRPNSNRPVLVWIHGGGFTQDGSRNYDGSTLAAAGTVVVTLNYRLGAFGFLAHPALTSKPGGPTGNYGLMDQQAALRWVQRNIAQFGGNPQNVTIAGQSAGGLAVLSHLVSTGSRGLFQRAIVESGAFALKQLSLADAEAFGKQVAAKAGCPDQTAKCLRGLSTAELVEDFPGAAIPGVVDGKVLTESIGTALAAGRFARVPLLNGINHNEELIFVAGLGLAVSGGSFVPVPRPLTDETYQGAVAAVLGVTASRAKAIASEYPTAPYGGAIGALSTLVSDANFACPALQVDRWTSKRVPTFAYQFDDDSAPQRFAPPGALPPIATHSAEIQYLFDQPNTPAPGTLNASQSSLAATMRGAWAAFAASGKPTTKAMRWPSFNPGSSVISLASSSSKVETTFASTHHCAFWAA